MNKKTQLSLTILATLIITACSGGGGNSPSNRVETQPQKMEAPKVQSPKVEAPKVEAPKAEAPKVEAPKVETPKAEAPKVEVPKAEAPKMEAPKVEAPKVETPKAEAPKVEAPKVEAPKVDAPKVEAPKVEDPKVEAPKVEAPKVEDPKVEAPKAEAPKVEAPKVEAPKAEAPKMEAPKVGVPKAEVPKVETPKVEAPKAETPKAEAPKAEAPKVEVPKAEAPKAEIPKMDEPQIDVPKDDLALKITGETYSVNDGNYTYRELENADDLDFLIVDGKKVQVGDKSKSAGEWSYSAPTFLSCCNNFDSVRFGSIGDYSNEVQQMFYNGQPTKVMPTSGVSAYQGDFMLEGKINDENAPQSIIGKVNLSADFGAKTLTGNLHIDPTLPINVTAEIQENRFKGKVTSKAFYQDAELSGKFYGENAKELGGIFTDKKQIVGAFGAAKQ